MRRAFTLPELLVSLLLMSIISLTLTLAFSSAYPALDTTLSRVELDLRCRQALERAVPVLESAMPAQQEALYAPADGADGPAVVFSSNQDFLGSPPVAFDPRAVPPGPFHTYSLGQEGTDLVLRELYANVPPQVLGRNVTTRFHRDGYTLRVSVSAQGRARNSQWQSTPRSWKLETLVGLPAYAR